MSHYLTFSCGVVCGAVAIMAVDIITLAPYLPPVAVSQSWLAALADHRREAPDGTICVVPKGASVTVTWLSSHIPGARCDSITEETPYEERKP